MVLIDGAAATLSLKSQCLYGLLSLQINGLSCLNNLFFIAMVFISAQQ